MTSRLSFLALLATAFALVAGPVLARCSQNVAGMPGVQLASLDGLLLAAGNSPSRAVITFVGHSSYQIDTPQGVRAILDWGGSADTVLFDAVGRFAMLPPAFLLVGVALEHPSRARARTRPWRA